MGIFSRFERRVEDGLEGAAGKMFDAPISPVQISKKAEKAMRREKMVGAGKQYAPTLYTVLVNAEDDQRLFGYYPTLAGETETLLAARASEDGLSMDGTPLVRFIVDETLKRGKFDVIAQVVSAPIIAQLRREEMARYGLVGKQAGSNTNAAQPSVAPTTAPTPAAAPVAAAPVGKVDSGPFAHQAYADRLAQSNADPADLADPAEELPRKKEPLPYVPEEEIDRSIDYGEYTFNSQDFEDYEQHGPSAQLIDPATADSYSKRTSEPIPNIPPAKTPDPEPEPTIEADLSGFDVHAYTPHVSQPIATETPNTVVFSANDAIQIPDRTTVTARLVNTATNRTYDLTGGRLLIGRSRTCDIVVDDINASRTHAELRCENGGAWVLTDLGSMNGTKVNGGRITSVDLAPGDKISLGVTDLVFLLA